MTQTREFADFLAASPRAFLHLDIGTSDYILSARITRTGGGFKAA
jgi:hypothetical protein